MKISISVVSPVFNEDKSLRPLVESLHKLIGDNHPLFFIAEAGVNHNGSIDLGKQLVDIAVEAGADAVKFQTFKTEYYVSKKDEERFDRLKSFFFSLKKKEIW